jgi:hypothetical protein
MNPIIEGVVIGVTLSTGAAVFLNASKTAIKHDQADALVGHSACGLLGLIGGLGLGAPVLALTYPGSTDAERTGVAVLLGLIAAAVLCCVRRLHQARRPA